jgi:hypothetical protein
MSFISLHCAERLHRHVGDESTSARFMVFAESRDALLTLNTVRHDLAIKAKVEVPQLVRPGVHIEKKFRVFLPETLQTL